MAQNEPINMPSLAGWAIAVAAGIVAAAISYVVVGVEANGSVLIAAVITVGVGVILGFNSGEVAAPYTAPQVETTAVTAPEAPAPEAPMPVVAPEPAAVAPAPMAAPAPMVQRKPEALAAARGGKADDLKLIKGVGPKLEALCNRLGFYHFDQIAAWSPEEIAWVDENLEGFKGRVSRDEWVVQARILAAGGTTEFSERQG